MSTGWETEDDEAQRTPPPPKLGYQVKAYLVLVDSDKQDWGVVEDTLNDLSWKPGQGETVGTWSRPAYDNFIHISLTTAINALQDRATQAFVKYAKEREQKEEVKLRPPRKMKKASEPTPEPQQELSVDEKLRFNALRARLGGAK